MRENDLAVGALPDTAAHDEIGCSTRCFMRIVDDRLLQLRTCPFSCRCIKSELLFLSQFVGVKQVETKKGSPKTRVAFFPICINEGRKRTK